MVDFTLFFLKIVSYSCILVFVGLEFFFEGLVFDGQLVDIAFDLSDFSVDFTVSIFVISDSFLDSFQFVSRFLILRAELLGLVLELFILLHQIQTLFSKFLYFNILAIKCSLQSVLFLFDFGKLCVIVFKLVFK